MKFGKTLQELAAELHRQRESKRDYVVSTQNLRFFPGPEQGILLDMLIEQQENDININRMEIGDIAHGQIGAYLGIPAKYYGKMRDEFPELLAANVNGWFSKGASANRMVRTLDGKARAYLSDRYRRIDNYEIAETVLPIIAEMPEAKVESCEITESRMYLKIVNPRLENEVVPGDIVQAGIMITNSEVGQGSVNIQPLVFRLVCTNGMVVNNAGAKQYHIGGRIGNGSQNYELFSDETLAADDNAFMLKVMDTVRAAVDETRFEKVVNLMREARGAKITNPDIPQVIELAGKDYGFTKEEGSGILTHLIHGGDLSLYGLANAVTRTSQDVKSYDRATELESKGYDILTMSSRQWRQLNG